MPNFNSLIILLKSLYVLLNTMVYRAKLPSFNLSFQTRETVKKLNENNFPFKNNNNNKDNLNR